MTIHDIFVSELTQISINKAVIDSVFLSQYDTEIINLGVVDYTFYDVLFRLINGKEIKYQLMAPAALGPSFRYKPFGNPLFTYPNITVKLRKTSIKSAYFDLKYGIIKNKFEYKIGIDQDSSGVDKINGSLPSGSFFNLPHQ